MGESWETCISRELMEEANLVIENTHFLKATNDVNLDGNPDKHYITLFMEADVSADSSTLTNMEPHKCEEWKWMDILALQKMSQDEPSQMFEPLLHFFEEGGVHSLLLPAPSPRETTQDSPTTVLSS